VIKSSDLVGIAAGLMGGAGVALSAVAAHAGGGDFARTSAEFLLLHAGALLGVSSALRASPPRRVRRLGLCAAGLALGAMLFCADLATLGFSGGRLFPLAAPLGGSLMIVSWLALALVFTLAE